MPEIKIEIHDESVKDALKGFVKKVKNPSPVMKIIGEYLARSTEDRFNRQGPAPDGTPWAPLKPATLKRKKHSKILTESGQLRGSIRYQLQGKDTVAIGTNKIYAAIHQLGGDINVSARSIMIRHRTDAKGNLLRTEQFSGQGLIFAKKRHKRVLQRWAEVGAHKFHIPARPYLGVSATDSTEIVRIINQYLTAR